MTGSFEKPLTGYWIVDSGATNHITSNKSWLIDLQLITTPLQFVYLPNGHRCRVTHIDYYMLSDEYLLTDVVLVPKFNYNLLSTLKMTTELSCKIIFQFDSLVVHDLCAGKMLVTSRQVKGMYILFAKDSCTKTICNEVSTKVFDGDLMVWHRHLGNVSIPQMSVLSSRLSSDAVNCVKNCIVCPLAKQTRL